MSEGEPSGNSMINVLPLTTDPQQEAVPPPPCSNPFSSRKSADWSAGGSHPLKCGSIRPQKELTIVIMGSTRVGKSALVNQFLHGVFQEEYKETVDDMHWIEYDAASPAPPVQVAAGGAKPEPPTDQKPDNNVGIFLLKIIDASGSRDFLGMRRLYEQQGDAFILVIAVDDQNSFEEAKIIKREISERNRKNAPVIVVLNKIDLKDLTINRKLISEVDVEEFAMETDSLFTAATATKYDSVVEVFQRLLQHHSSIPSTSQLKYRRKSVPVSMSMNDLGQMKSGGMTRSGSGIPSNRSRVNTFSGGKNKNQDILEEENETGEEKRANCVLS